MNNRNNESKILTICLTAGLILAALVTVPHGYFSFAVSGHVYPWALFISNWIYHLFIAFTIIFFIIWERKHHDGSFLSTLYAVLIIAAIINVLKYTPFGHLTPRPNGYQGGFPSGHTATAFAMAYFMSVRAPKLTVPLVLTAVVIGFSRIFAGAGLYPAHYPYQVITGSLAGTYLAWGISKWQKRKLQ